jgi:hypothetical protein
MARRPQPDFSELDEAVAAWAKALGARSRKLDSKGRTALLAAIEAHPKAAWTETLEAFETRFGGVEMAPRPKDEADRLVLGAQACFEAGLKLGDAGRVPVGWMADRVYYVDAKGQFWDRDEVSETKASRFAKGIDAFVSLAVAWCFYLRQSPRGWIAGSRGRGIAKERDLPPLEGRPKMWGDASRVVFEQARGRDERTYAAGPTMEALFPRSTRRGPAAAMRYMGGNTEVNRWFIAHEGAKRDVLKYLRELVIRGDTRIEERMADVPTFSYKGDLARVVPVADTEATIEFPQGAHIPGEHPRLEGTGKDVRTLRIASTHEGNQAAKDIANIVTAWCDWRDARSPSNDG